MSDVFTHCVRCKVSSKINSVMITLKRLLEDCLFSAVLRLPKLVFKYKAIISLKLCVQPRYMELSSVKRTRTLHKTRTFVKKNCHIMSDFSPVKFNYVDLSLRHTKHQSSVKIHFGCLKKQMKFTVTSH